MSDRVVRLSDVIHSCYGSPEGDLCRRSSTSMEDDKHDENDAALVVYTSETKGKPKGGFLTNHNVAIK